MKRFLDPLFFLLLLVLDVVGWFLVSLTKSLPTADLQTMPTMTVAVVIVIAAPTLAFMTLISLARVLLKVPPRQFWAWMTGAATVFAICLGAAYFVTSQMDLQVGFVTGIWLMAITAFCSVIMLFLAALGAIPEPATISMDIPVDSVDGSKQAISEEPIEHLSVDSSQESK